MKLTREILGQVFEKTNGFCWYCGTGISPFGNWEVDHQTPKAQQGSDETGNLVPSCRSCNSRKGPRNVEEFRKYLRSRLVCKISDTEDFVREFADNLPTVSQSSIDSIADLIYHAAQQATWIEIEFYAERIAHHQAEPLSIQPESESEAVS